MGNFIPVGLIIDTHKSSAVKYQNESMLKSEIVGLMAYDTDKSDLVQLFNDAELDRLDKFKFVGKDLIYNRISVLHYVIYKIVGTTGSEINSLSFYHIPVYDKIGNLINQLESKIFFKIGRFYINMDVSTLTYTVCEKSKLDYRESLFESYSYTFSDSLLKLFTELHTGLYFQDGLCIVSNEFQYKTLMLPEDCEYLIFYYYRNDSIDTIVFNRKLLAISEIDESLLSSVKHIAVSKSINQYQLVEIINMLNKSNGYPIAELESFTLIRDYDSAYNLLYRVKEEVEELLKNIEVTVY